MEYTGERYVPSVVKSMVITLEHWHRYLIAANFVCEKKVLDIACGAGYGSAMLSKVASKVVGGDVSEENIAYCKEKYSAGNLNFQIEDIANLSFPDSTFDVVTCFETIEHVDEFIQIQALSEIKRVMKPDGTLLITTPNIDSKHYKNVDNKFHVKELNKKEFIALLSDHFVHVELSSQYQNSCSAILPVGRKISCSAESPKSYESASFAKINSECLISDVLVDGGKFFVAGCSDVGLQPISGSTLLDDDNSLYQEYQSYISSLQEVILMKDKVIAESNRYIQSLKKAIEEKDEYIKRLSEE